MNTTRRNFMFGFLKRLFSNTQSTTQESTAPYKIETPQIDTSKVEQVQPNLKVIEGNNSAEKKRTTRKPRNTAASVADKKPAVRAKTATKKPRAKTQP